MNRRLAYEQFKNLQSSTKRSESPQRNRQPLLIEPAGHYLEKRLASLHDLPVKLLYEMLLVSLNPSFTVLSRHIRSVFKSTSPQFRANYVIVATESHNLREQRFDVLWWGQRLQAWLCYGVCDREVFQLLISQAQLPETVHRVVPCESNNKFQLPARILRSLARTRLESRDAYLARAASAVDFLRYLLGPIELPAPALAQDSQPNNQVPLTMFGDANSHGGYLLAEAVMLGSEPLVDLLLAHGAEPLRQAGMAVSLAITKKDEPLVRKLVSKCNNELLRGPIGRALLAFAVQKNARDIVDILLKEQQIQPDAKTLELLNGWVDYQM